MKVDDILAEACKKMFSLSHAEVVYLTEFTHEIRLGAMHKGQMRWVANRFDVTMVKNSTLGYDGMRQILIDVTIERLRRFMDGL